MDDSNVCIGDCYLMGDVLLQVSAPRSPCNKISHRYNIQNLDRFVGEQGITGWYYRVITPGTLHEMDEVTLISRPRTTLTVADLMKGIANKDKAIVRAGLEIKALDPDWYAKCQRILGNG